MVLPKLIRLHFRSEKNEQCKSGNNNCINTIGTQTNSSAYQLLLLQINMIAYLKPIMLQKLGLHILHHMEMMLELVDLTFILSKITRTKKIPLELH